MNDFQKRDLGSASLIALNALEKTIWDRSVEVMDYATQLHVTHALSDAEARAILIQLVELRRTVQALETQIEEGLRAVQRITTREARVATEAAKEARVLQHGRNRFVRSRVASPEGKLTG